MACNADGFVFLQFTRAMQAVEQRTGQRWAGFRDSAFALNLYVQRMLKGLARKTPRGKRFNKRMAGVRVSVENAFAEVMNQWGFVSARKMQKLGSMPVAKHVACAFLLHNCHGILQGNQASCMFGHDLCAGLSLQTYIDKCG